MSKVTVNQIEKRQFTCFKKLPPELRLKIWKLSLPEGRTLEVKIAGSYKGLIWQYSYYETPTEGFYKFPLVQFHTCSEARLAATKCYPMMFKDIDCPFFFDVDVDVLHIIKDRHIGRGKLMKVKLSKDFGRVQNLLISAARPARHQQDPLEERHVRCIERFLRKFKNLQELVFEDNSIVGINVPGALQSGNQALQGSDLAKVNPWDAVLAQIWQTFDEENRKKGKRAYSPPVVSMIDQRE